MLLWNLLWTWIYKLQLEINSLNRTKSTDTNCDAKYKWHFTFRARENPIPLIFSDGNWIFIFQTFFFPQSVFFYFHFKWIFAMVETYTCKIKLFKNFFTDPCKALFTRDILAHNIAIKRYCNKKIFLSHGFHWLTKVSS